jgi:predicted MFS family arabinose efflux permease
MIPLGVGQMIGGALMGQVIDRKGMKVGIVFSLFQVTLAFGVMLWYVYTYQFSWLTYIVTFCWGLQDSSMNNLMFCTLGFEFKEDDGADEVTNEGQEKKVDKTTPFSVQNFV